MPAPKPIELPRLFELYMPTQCRCGNPLPAAEREDIFAEAKQKMVDWFGGGSIEVASVRGMWSAASGNVAEEIVDVIYCNASSSAHSEHLEEFTAYAAELANRLTQETFACRVDRKMFIYPSTQDPKPHRCALGSAPAKLPEPLTADAVARAKVLQASLQRIDGLDDARDLFCNVLHYEYENEILPTRDWPDSVKQCLAPDSAPRIIADQNGFKIIYLQLAEGSLRKAHERQIVQRILKDLPDLRGLVVVSDVTRKQWNLINVKFPADRKRQSGVMLRRMRIGANQAVRTAVERLLEIDVEKLGEDATAAQLQDAHDRAFDVEAVTKQFFNDVANWYFWALKHSTFPKDAPKEADGHDHVSLIRLITRLIFCWFLREKGLMPDELFDRRKLKDILEGFAPDKVSNKDSVYYRAILQNLFFATLSTEMDKRAWVREDQNFMAHSLYRFKECFQKPGTGMDLFKSIPFLNGGLFECLDKDLGENAKPRYVRIDGFSRRADSQPTVPDFLFFGPEREVDLSKAYGDKKFKSVTVRGLIDTLRHYNFTIEENTPIEQEVALDPELCGKVFENLLAAYNPETGATARKQTGSFYTPREIVNYMVDEALIASLKTKLETALPAAKEIEPRLRQLFCYDDETNPFTLPETETLIAAIDSLKTLDPAVGSGAFPMGMLHKLVFVLGKLDPDNARWRERQRQRAVGETDAAFKLGDKEERQRRLEDINEVFEQNASDYGRKLYLIENCIYGVDIQAIAVQIAKMRFFISLIVDQKINDQLPNRGVRPLPNLETKFVAANSLIGIERPGQQLLRNLDIDKKEAELRRVRERHFLARTPKQKTKCREQDDKLRNEIAELLKDDGWDNVTARKLASWNPYDQNASADFFDLEWMFGIMNGFNIVIANPPYVQITKDRFSKRELEAFMLFDAFSYKADLYELFLERTVELLMPNGVGCYITPIVWLTLQNSEPLRKFLLDRTTIRTIRIWGDGVFENAVVSTHSIVFEKCNSNTPIKIHTDFGDKDIALQTIRKRPYLRINFQGSGNAEELLTKIENSSTALGEICEASQGITPYDKYRGHDPKLISSRGYHATEKRDKTYGPWLNGRDITRFKVEWRGEWLSYGDWLGAPREACFFTSDKLLCREVPGAGKRIQAAYHSGTIYCGHAISPVIARQDKRVNLKFLLGIINSALVSWYAGMRCPNFAKDIFPKLNPSDIKQLPVPEASTDKQKGIERLVDRILAAKTKNSDADTSALEFEIDQLVYSLYGLTPEEIKIVERSSTKV